LVNTRGYFQPLLELLSRAVAERFMDERHPLMWQVVARPEEVPDALERAPAWTAESRSFASA
jgi:predicted Rossmann-fold nucleotide-binding protein